jgi:hypothetical protein
VVIERHRAGRDVMIEDVERTANETSGASRRTLSAKERDLTRSHVNEIHQHSP